MANEYSNIDGACQSELDDSYAATANEHKYLELLNDSDAHHATTAWQSEIDERPPNPTVDNDGYEIPVSDQNIVPLQQHPHETPSSDELKQTANENESNLYDYTKDLEILGAEKVLNAYEEIPLRQNPGTATEEGRYRRARTDELELASYDPLPCGGLGKRAPAEAQERRAIGCNWLHGHRLCIALVLIAGGLAATLAYIIYREG